MGRVTIDIDQNRGGVSFSLLKSEDLHLFNEGRHTRLYERLGCTLTEAGDAAYFAIWAPDASAVSVFGEFNHWGKAEHDLSRVGESGLWEGVVDGVGHGDAYKFHIKPRDGKRGFNKADPFAAYTETPPETASRVWALNYVWSDDEWMSSRGERGAHDAPVAIYEVHLGSWKRQGDGRPLTYRELAETLPDHVFSLGFTHVELVSVMEYPYGPSWGYQTMGYFAPTARYGTPEDLMFLIDRFHQLGIGVILDWVPSRFPVDDHGLARFDGTHLYEHADPRQGFHPDWGSAIFNYGRNEVRSFLLSSAFSWIDRYHVDGLRVDAVSPMLYLDYSREDGEWIPNESGGNENREAMHFLRDLNSAVYGSFPGVQTFAEESTAWEGVSRPVHDEGLGSGYKWDMGWMNDTLRYLGRDPIHCSHHQGELTFRSVYANNENYVLPLSHDEVVHGKGSLLTRMHGDPWQRLANLRLLYTYLFTTPGKRLLFMGSEFGQVKEWDHDSSLDWHLLDQAEHRGVFDLTRALAHAYKSTSALHRGDHDSAGFQWVDGDDAARSLISYLRVDPAMDSPALVVLNFTPGSVSDYTVGVPEHGVWQEIINSDAAEYVGSGLGNGGSVTTGDSSHGSPASLTLNIPPLGRLILPAPIQPEAQSV